MGNNSSSSSKRERQRNSGTRTGSHSKKHHDRRTTSTTNDGNTLKENVEENVNMTASSSAESHKQQRHADQRLKRRQDKENHHAHANIHTHSHTQRHHSDKTSSKRQSSGKNNESDQLQSNSKRSSEGSAINYNSAYMTNPQKLQSASNYAFQRTLSSNQHHEALKAVLADVNGIDDGTISGSSSLKMKPLQNIFGRRDFNKEASTAEFFVALSRQQMQLHQHQHPHLDDAIKQPPANSMPSSSLASTSTHSPATLMQDHEFMTPLRVSEGTSVDARDDEFT